MPAAAQPWKASQPLHRGNAAERLLAELRTRILNGEITRGAKMPTEKELATAYGVSSATVREAVRGLATAQLVEVRHGSGAYVTADVDQLMGMSLRSIIEMERITMPQVLAVYGAINGYAAELAARHATPAMVRALQQAQDDIASAKSLPAISEALTRFLDTLARCSGNALLVALCRFLAGMQIGLATELSGGSYSIRRTNSAKLGGARQTLIDAIKAKDDTAARKAARRYQEQALAVLSALPRAGKARVADPALSKLLASLLHP